jgi:hypothetical protein
MAALQQPEGRPHGEASSYGDFRIVVVWKLLSSQRLFSLWSMASCSVDGWVRWFAATNHGAGQL